MYFKKLIKLLYVYNILILQNKAFLKKSFINHKILSFTQIFMRRDKSINKILLVLYFHWDLFDLLLLYIYFSQNLIFFPQNIENKEEEDDDEKETNEMS